MALIDKISRKFLVDVIQASSFSNEPEAILVVQELKSNGLYAEATENDIDKVDALDEKYNSD